MSGRAPCASICRSTSSSPTTSSPRPWSSPRDWQQRERVKAKLEQALATEFPSVVGRVYPLELGPPVGWPLQYRVSGPEPDQVRAIAFKVAQEIGSDPRRRERQLQLDGAGAHGQDPGRPGPGPPPGPELAGSGPVPEHGRVRRHRHPDAQRDLSRRRAGPGLRRAAHVAVDDPHASGAAAERADRSAEPDRLRRLRPGISHRLASGPAAHRDGAGRRRARHAGRHGRAGAGAEDRGAECQPAERLPHRGRRHGRGEQQGAGVGRRRPAVDAHPDRSRC